MIDRANYDCPHCGEANDIAVDPSGGRRQEYVEDCTVCCRPVVLSLLFDEEGLLNLDCRAE